MEKGKMRWRRILNSGYDEPIYEKYRNEIILQNSRMVKTTSFIGSIIMILLTITAFFVPSVSKVLPLYLTVAILFSIIYIVACVVGTRNGTITLLCNYAFLLAAFFFAIGLDVIQGNATATTVCVLLVALPLLIVDKPAREFPFFLLISVCFMYESIYIKMSPKASIDVLNAISFFIVGGFLGYKHNQMVLRNIRGQRLLEKQRDTDTLTSLYNKGAVETRAVEFLKKADATASLIVIDMDNFKKINDSYGHHAGDEILREMGKLLTSLFRNSDLISRFGGDEFVLFLPTNDKKDILQRQAEQILEGVKKIRISADPDYRAQVCMGIAIFPEDGKDYESLFRSADTAMYEVKKRGKNGYAFYDAAAKKQILLVDDVEINRAVLKESLRLDYDVLEAENGHQALGILKKTAGIDLIITDIQMPRMDGVALIRSVRSSEEYDNIAIIANTQYGDMEQEERLFELGVDDFVYKAASPGVVQKRVKNVLRAKNEI